MNDLEISKALALAIGWREAQIQVLGDIHFGEMEDLWCLTENGWREFDYRDWNVIGPIAERYDRFPYLTAAGCWTTWTGQDDHADTPQKAIALAVIGAKK